MQCYFWNFWSYFFLIKELFIWLENLVSCIKEGCSAFLPIGFSAPLTDTVQNAHEYNLLCPLHHILVHAHFIHGSYC